MSSAVINSLGLVFDIAGVVVLFYYGPPTLSITRDGHKILPFNSNDEDETKKNKALATKHHRRSTAGLVLLFFGFVFFGFVFQLVSNWVR